MLTEARLHEVADQLVQIPGVIGVMLGGSRARGAAQPDSDVDLGVNYRPPLDIAGLQTLAELVADEEADRSRVTSPGEWGPWVDGGGWLTINGTAVDWLYRNVDRVEASVQAAWAGASVFHFQVGHPLGVPDFAYAGELALGLVLADPREELTRLRAQIATYPPKLTEAMMGRLTEAEFVLGTLRKPARRGDVAYVAGALFRVVGLCAHALHAKAGRWVINEKGLIDAAGQLAVAPADFALRTHSVFAELDTTPASLGAAIDSAASLVAEVRAPSQTEPV